MSAAKLRRRRAKVVRLLKPAKLPPEHRCHTPYLEAADGLRLLALALDGFYAHTHDFSLSSEDVRRRLDPLMALVDDIQDAMQRGE